MTMLMARFCDFVLGFELEAESLYLKANSIYQSMKLQQSKGFDLDNDTCKTQHFILSTHCTSKTLDKILFANHKLLNFLDFTPNTLISLKQLLPDCISLFHDDKILNFLKNKGKTSSIIEINSWIRVKQGYVVPV